MLAIDFTKDLPNLCLCQSFAIETAGQLFTLNLLVPEQSQYHWMKVAVPVPGDPELKYSTLAITLALSIAITLVIGVGVQKITPFGSQYALYHKLHEVL
jgi:hypothetical protein